MYSGNTLKVDLNRKVSMGWWCKSFQCKICNHKVCKRGYGQGKRINSISLLNVINGKYDTESDKWEGKSWRFHLWVSKGIKDFTYWRHNIWLIKEDQNWMIFTNCKKERGMRMDSAWENSQWLRRKMSHISPSAIRRGSKQQQKRVNKWENSISN